MHRTPARLCAAAACLLTLPLILVMPGCLIGQHSNTKISGTYVQPSDLSQVRLNHSTSDDVLNILGSPSAKRTDSDATEVWSWSWTRQESGSGHVFLLFNGSSNKKVDQSAHIRFQNGIAIEKWRD